MGKRSTFEVFRSVFNEWPGHLRGNEDYVNASLYFELKTFLHGLLVVEDKLSMAHSLETRAPFLDNDLVDFAVRLPESHKLPNLIQAEGGDENAIGKRQRHSLGSTDGKQVLRRAMDRIVPNEFLARAK